MTAQTLEQLSAEWLAAKRDEAAANKRRVAIEDQIVAIVGKKDEGSQTSEADGYKITTTGKISRKMDWAAWETVKAKISPNLWPVKMKPELDEKGVKYLQANEPEIYALLPIEVKPAKTAIEVKAVEA
jgi:hypothetical protein